MKKELEIQRLPIDPKFEEMCKKHKLLMEQCHREIAEYFSYNPRQPVITKRKNYENS